MRAVSGDGQRKGIEAVGLADGGRPPVFLGKSRVEADGNDIASGGRLTADYIALSNRGNPEVFKAGRGLKLYEVAMV
jgi:hypothetical protein